jgi:hypothetical protein
MPPTLRAASIVASVVIATLLTFPISRIEIHSRDVLFIAAVIVASRYAGATAGLSAALLSVLVLTGSLIPLPMFWTLRSQGLPRQWSLALCHCSLPRRKTAASGKFVFGRGEQEVARLNRLLRVPGATLLQLLAQRKNVTWRLDL